MKGRLPLFGVVNDADTEAAAVNVLRSGQIASGAGVEAFRQGFGQLVGSDQLITTSDMSSAISIALRLAGAGPGTEVIANPFACLSTNSPIALSGAQVRWADMVPGSASIDVDDVARLITPRTRAVIAYHVNGYPGPAAKLAALCRDAGVSLIEDCDNALGAVLEEGPVGSFGDFAVYSFYPNRQINGIEGGGLVCRHAVDFERAKRLRRFGIDQASFRDAQGEINPLSDVNEIGWSATMNNLNSSVAAVQLRGFAGRLARTQHNAACLTSALSGIEGLEPVRPLAGSSAAYWTYAIRTGGRDAVLAEVKARGVDASRLHHRSDDYSGFKAERRALPGVDDYSATALHIPCGWWLTEDQILDVATVVKAAVAQYGGGLP